MLTPKEEKRIADTFKLKDGAKAVVITGCIMAAYSIGADPAHIAATLHSGFLEILKFLPLESADFIASQYFSGASAWFGTIGLGVSDYLTSLGAPIPELLSSLINDMREDTQSLVSNSRELFNSMVHKSSELASLWRGAVRSILPPSAIETAKSMAEMLPASPKDMVKALYKVGQTAAECYATAKALKHGYKWVLGKFKKDSVENKGTEKKAEAIGVPVEAVANLHVNVALGGDEVAEQGAEQIRNIIEAAGDRAITFNIGEKAVAKSLENADDTDQEVNATDGQMVFENNLESERLKAHEEDILVPDHVAWTSTRLNADLRKMIHTRISEIKLNYEILNVEKVLAERSYPEAGYEAPLKEGPMISRDASNYARNITERSAAIAKFLKENQIPIHSSSHELRIELQAAKGSPEGPQDLYEGDMP